MGGAEAGGVTWPCLREECRGLPGKAERFGSSGEAQFRLKAHEGARVTWEAVRTAAHPRGCSSQPRAWRRSIRSSARPRPVRPSRFIACSGAPQVSAADVAEAQCARRQQREGPLGGLWSVAERAEKGQRALQSPMLSRKLLHAIRHRVPRSTWTSTTPGPQCAGPDLDPMRVGRALPATEWAAERQSKKDRQARAEAAEGATRSLWPSARWRRASKAAEQRNALSDHWLAMSARRLLPCYGASLAPRVRRAPLPSLRRSPMPRPSRSRRWRLATRAIYRGSRTPFAAGVEGG